MIKKSSLTIIILIALSLIIPINTTHAAAATVQIAPPTTNVEMAKNFTVSLTVTDVTDLAVWEYRIFYLNSILNCTSAVKGLFLEKDGHTQFFTFTIYNAYSTTYGMLLVGSSLVAAVPGVNGSGILANVTFQAIGSGDTPLHFDNDPAWNFLLDSTPPPRHPIPFTTVDGTVHVTPTHDIAVTNVTSSKKVIFQGFCGNITTTIANNGKYFENVNVTVYANMTSISNATVIGTFMNVLLTNGTSANLTLTWNTTTFMKGNYTLVASADPVPGETNTADNSYADGYIILPLLLGDLTGGTASPWDFIPDGKCDGKDVSIVAKCFGSYPGCPSPLIWNANCDITGQTLGIPDGKCDGKDVSLVAKHFGESHT